MSDWIEVKLGDICEFISRGITPNYSDDGILVLNQKCIRDNRINSALGRFTAIDTKINSSKLLKSGDILINSTGTGTLGRVSIYKGASNCVTVDGHVTILRMKEGVSPVYLGYFLHSMEPLIENLGRGSTNQKELSTGDLKRIRIVLPDITNQNKVAEQLSVFDSMIDNNSGRIELLEQAAQELYKEWFVRFRFPGYEAAKFENGLPQGWSYEKFKDGLTYNTGKLDSNAAVLDGEYSFYTCAKTIYKTNTYCFDGECVLLGGNNATGDFSLFYANEKLDAYQRTYIVTPQNQTLSCAYIYFVLKDYLLQFKTASIGATTKFLTKGMLDKAKILVPDEKTILRYNEIAKNMFDQIVSLKAKTENLVSQRDMLLPRLMSGKLEV